MDDPRTPDPAAAAAPPPPTAASAEEALKPPAAPPAEPVTPGKGVKETIESILIAFVLAFVFRAFVVEAFVIPTGSMATTLLGAHLRFTCDECGYRFDANYPNASSGDDIRITTEPLGETKYDVFCANCRHKMSTTPDQTVRYGDRILVLKYLYVPWVSDPQRWDVVVFKSPASTGTKDPPYTVNYIKRLVGLPNEQVMVLYGDLYTRKDDGEPWQIQAKPKYAQDALWRVVYDHDHRPLEKNRKDGWVMPWRADGGSGWDTGDAQKSRVIAFDNMTGEGRLRFAGDKPPQAPDLTFKMPGYFTDWLSYDVVLTGPSGGLGGYQTYPVNDLRLCFSYERKAGDGPLRARLSKQKREFVLELLPDRIRLMHVPPGKGDPEEVGAVKPADVATMTGPLRVEFADVDCEVTVRLNEHLVFQKRYAADVDDLIARARRDDRLPPPAVSIEAGRQRATLSHVSLWRDVYYTPAGSGEWTQRQGDRPMHSIRLGPDEYFVLGDNSAASSDARFWTEAVDLTRDEDLYAEAGRVPGRFMLGRAFFVYWPAGHKPFNRSPAIIPDFGSMRLIH